MHNFGFEIPFRLPSLNEYIDKCRNNRYGGAKHKKDIEREILRVLPKCQIDCPVKLKFVWHEQTRRRDPDNVCGGGRKYILDSMQKSGMIPNDNTRYILGFEDEFVYGQGDKVKVMVKTGGNDVSK